jgi:SAM-dependent methyltransferase
MEPGGSAHVTVNGGAAGASAEPDGASVDVARSLTGAVTRAQHAARRVRAAAATEAYRDRLVLDVFAQPVRDYVYQCLGRPISLLQAGCLTPVSELGLDKLRESGFEINVLTVDAARLPDTPSDGIVVGDLRTVPLPPRSLDIVHCSLLLDRISHVALVLDRFAAALRPGGLLLLRLRDRDSAAAFLDRRLPGWMRRALWKRLYPGRPGPLPAVYEPVTSARGIAAYLLERGLVITYRKPVRTLPDEPGRLCRCLATAHRVIARLSRGRLTDAHDEMLFVIRKPEDRFARVVLISRHFGGKPARERH